MVELTIRPAVQADAQIILDYLNQVGGESDNLLFGANGFQIPADQEAAVIQRFETTPRCVMLTGYCGEELVSIASLQGLGRERIAHRGELAVSVKKAYWGQGVGKRMLEALIAFGRQAGLKVLELQVREDNVRAIRLYRSLGFVEIGKYPKFFNIGGKDYGALLMNLYL